MQTISCEISCKYMLCIVLNSQYFMMTVNKGITFKNREPLCCSPATYITLYVTIILKYLLSTFLHAKQLCTLLKLLYFM